MPLTALPLVGTRLYRRVSNGTPEERAERLARLVLADIENAPTGWLDMITDDIRMRDSLTYAEDAYIQSSRGLIRAYLRRGPDDAWRDAARVQAPTLLVFGQRDRLVPLAVGRRAREAFPNSRLVVLPPSGHVAQIEHAQLVADQFVRFAADVSTVAAS